MLDVERTCSLGVFEWHVLGSEYIFMVPLTEFSGQKTARTVGIAAVEPMEDHLDPRVDHDHLLVAEGVGAAK